VLGSGYSKGCESPFNGFEGGGWLSERPLADFDNHYSLRGPAGITNCTSATYVSCQVTAFPEGRYGSEQNRRRRTGLGQMGGKSFQVLESGGSCARCQRRRSECGISILGLQRLCWGGQRCRQAYEKRHGCTLVVGCEEDCTHRPVLHCVARRIKSAWRRICAPPQAIAEGRGGRRYLGRG
jgi:hypothetical protein